MGLDSVEFVMEVEDEFGVKIADPDAEQMRTIGDVVRHLARLEGIDMDSGILKAGDAARIEDIRKRVHGIVVEMFRADPALLSDSTHFVDDLEMD